MRIVYVWDADYPWDVRTEKVCAALSAAGHQVHIVARNREWRMRWEPRPEGTVHRMRPWRLLGRRLDAMLSFPAFPSVRWLSHIYSSARDVFADLIIVRDLPLCPTAIAAGRLLKIPVVMDMAENYPAMIAEIWHSKRHKPWDILVRNPRLVERVERSCLPRLDGVIVVVEESGARIASLGVPAQKIAVVSNTPSRRRVASAPESRAAGPVQVVYLGLLELPRGVAELIDAMAILHRDAQPVQLRIIGDGRDRDLLEQRAEALKLPAGVIEFLGRLPHAEALAEVARAHIGVVPHHADDAWNTTIPNKFFDYMAAGLAVISSDAAPPARILEKTGAGITFESGNPQSLADAIARLCDSELRAEMSAAGQRAILSTYNWETDSAALWKFVAGFRADASARATLPKANSAPPARPTIRKARK